MAMRAEPADESIDDTIVVDRSSGDDEHTIVVDRSGDDDERTIIVDRSSDVDGETIIVERSRRLPGLDDDDDTDRAVRPRDEFDVDDDTDPTVVRPRPDDDETIQVDRGAPSVSLPPVPSLRPARVQRRRGIAPPPIPVGFAPAARPAVGPGAVAHYQPRELAVPPVSARAVASTTQAQRVIDPALPSVVRRQRRTRTLALLVFACTCVVSLAGIVLILTRLF